MKPHELFPLMEGLVGTMALSTDSGQHVAQWVETCKKIMLLPGNRDLSTWKFQAISDIDEDGSTETGDADLIAATKFYAMLIGTIDNTAEHRFVAVYDADSATFDGTAALANSVVCCLMLEDAGSASVEEFYGVVFPRGIKLGTGLTVASDGVDGANTGTSEIRGWLLYI